jgi:hypothetical protein
MDDYDLKMFKHIFGETYYQNGITELSKMYIFTFNNLICNFLDMLMFLKSNSLEVSHKIFTNTYVQTFSANDTHSSMSLGNRVRLQFYLNTLI